MIMSYIQMPPTLAQKCLQFRHDCQHLGCADHKCPLCFLCQKRRCSRSFKKKYLASTDILEASCGAQIYVVVVDALTGALVQYGLEHTYLEVSIVDGRKLDSDMKSFESIEASQILLNKQGAPLLVHGRSGTYTDEKKVSVPTISGQVILPELKITDSSEALLGGRAPPLRLVARLVQRGGIPLLDVAPVLSEPFVVATARVRSAAKAPIPHVDDSVSKLEGVGLMSQKKLADIAAAANAAKVPRIHVPSNSVTKVGQFRELVEAAEASDDLKKELKHILRLATMWDVARGHAQRAVHTDGQLRAYHPDGRDDVALVYRCTCFNVLAIDAPVGIMRKRQTTSTSRQEIIVDIAWLANDAKSWPAAVQRLVPLAASAWWQHGHPGWRLLPLNKSHVPKQDDQGNPQSPMSSFSFAEEQEDTDSPKSFNSPDTPSKHLVGGAGLTVSEQPLQGWMNKALSDSMDYLHSTRIVVSHKQDDQSLSASLQSMESNKFSTPGKECGFLDHTRSLLPMMTPNSIGDHRRFQTSGLSPSCLPDCSPVQVPGLTMGQLRDAFWSFLHNDSLAARDGLKQFLRIHGLLPQGSFEDTTSCLDDMDDDLQQSFPDIFLNSAF